MIEEAERWVRAHEQDRCALEIAVPRFWHLVNRLAGLDFDNLSARMPRTRHGATCGDIRAAGDLEEEGAGHRGAKGGGGY